MIQQTNTHIHTSKEAKKKKKMETKFVSLNINYLPSILLFGTRKKRKFHDRDQLIAK